MIEQKSNVTDTRPIYGRLYDEIAANHEAVAAAEKDLKAIIRVWKNEAGECFISMTRESNTNFTEKDVKCLSVDLTTFLKHMESHLNSRPKPKCLDENDDKEADDEQLPPPPDQVDVPDDVATEEVEGFTVIIRMRKGYGMYHLVFGTLPPIEIIAAAMEVCEHNEKNTQSHE